MTGSSEELAAKVAAAGGMEQLRDSGAFDELMEQIDSGELQIDGKNGFLNQMIKAVLERGLKSELSGHLGYEKGDPAARILSNSRNGFYPKTLASQAGDVELAIPRDRNGTFVPRLVPKGSRRTGGLDEIIVSLYAGGMTVRDIQHHLESTIGTELSHETISKITDDVLDEVMIWQRRPLDPIYPILYLDAIVVKIRDGAQVRNKAAHIAVGIDMDGIKHVLGIWVEAIEGAKFWAGVCAELANRGVRDVLIVCCDGLTGFPEAIAATWPLATVQTCVVHLIRASMRFVAYNDRRKVAAHRAGLLPHRTPRRRSLDALGGTVHRRLRPAHRRDKSCLAGHERQATRRRGENSPPPWSTSPPRTTRPPDGSREKMPSPRSRTTSSARSNKSTATATSPPHSPTTEHTERTKTMPEDNTTPMQRMMDDFAPTFVSLTDDVLFGQVWSRPELSRRDCSLITITTLIGTRDGTIIEAQPAKQ
jgi:transposase-like protein